MSEHLQNLSLIEAIEKNEKLMFPVKESNKWLFRTFGATFSDKIVNKKNLWNFNRKFRQFCKLTVRNNLHDACTKSAEDPKSRLVGKLRYWWSLSFAGILLLFVALPMMIFLRIINRQIWLYPFCMWGAKTWIRASGAKVEVFGRENLAADKSYIFVANHYSYLDTTALFAYTGKKVGLVAKKEILKVPVLGRGISFINFLTIDRSNPERARQTLDKARELVESGYSFGLFAEGTRAMPGELLPFKKGAFHLALQTGAAIVPVVFKNTDYIMGKKTGVVNPGTMEIVLLPPIETKDSTETDLPDLLKKVRGAIAKELRSEK